LINLTAFIVFTIIAEAEADEYYRSQYPNLVANLIISMISAGFIEKQKRKDFMQYSELLLRKDELDLLNDQKNRVISILSHDVSAPLRSISGLLTTYERSQITKEELDRFLPDVKARVDKVSLLVHSLVRWSRSQMKGFVVQKTDIDLELLIMDNITLIKPFLGEKKIFLKAELEAGLSVHADHEMLNLVIRNLLSNAVKFTSSGNRILVRTFRRNDKIAVEVSNEGEPIPVVVIEKLFTFQIPSRQGTANETGTGLGLAMSQQFTNLNGGKIFLERRQDSGNTFCVELPAS
jgi:two-component system sensor histidine kinase/response regulator